MVAKKRLAKNFNISNRLSYPLIAFVALVLMAAGVYSLTAGVAPNPGHTLNEVAPPSPCLVGQTLNWTGSAWTCVTENFLPGLSSGRYFGGKFYPVGTVFTCNPGGINFTVTVTSNGFTSRCYATDVNGNPELPPVNYDSGTQNGLFASVSWGTNIQSQWCVIGSPTWVMDRANGNLNIYGLTVPEIPYGLITANDRIIGVGRHGGNTLSCYLISS